MTSAALPTLTRAVRERLARRRGYAVARTEAELKHAVSLWTMCVSVEHDGGHVVMPLPLPPGLELPAGVREKLPVWAAGPERGR